MGDRGATRAEQQDSTLPPGLLLFRATLRGLSLRMSDRVRERILDHRELAVLYVQAPKAGLLLGEVITSVPSDKNV